MTSIKHGFQSEILRIVNPKSSLNVVHLAKKYGTLRFKDSTQCVLDIIFLLGKQAVTNSFVFVVRVFKT